MYLIHLQLIPVSMTHMILFLHCRSLRNLAANDQLTGTIPPQLGNLIQLTYLYAQIRLVFLENIYYI